PGTWPRSCGTATVRQSAGARHDLDDDLGRVLTLIGWALLAPRLAIPVAGVRDPDRAADRARFRCGEAPTSLGGGGHRLVTPVAVKPRCGALIRVNTLRSSAVAGRPWRR